MSTAVPHPKPSFVDLLKRVLLGRAQPSWRIEHTLLPKFLALPILASDPLSSVAYATEAALGVLLGASASGTRFIMPIALAIAALLAIVVISYVQVVKGYPSGGGAYVVARENLGTMPSLVGGAALLVDYVMTVAVSVVAGIVAIVSFAPGLAPYRVELSVGCVILLTLANLRGVREAGLLFAFPTYAFIVSIFAMITLGLVRCVGGCPHPEAVAPLPTLVHTAGPISLFILLHAFSSGATALTGVEAISNAVPIFRRPQSKNAQLTLLVMGVTAITMFLGVSFLTTRMHPIPSEQRSVVAQLAQAIFNGGPGFYIVQIFTTLILVLAANTSYQGFPRLLAIMAQDRFMPRQLRNLGDRLVYSNGIIVLAGVSIVLIWAFQANLDKLIQLYIVGVFTAFTLSQFGMVRHWRRVARQGERTVPGWRRSMIINAVGGISTGVVLLITAYTKFLEGAWIAIIGMAIIVGLSYGVHRHYLNVREQLRTVSTEAADLPGNHVVLLVPDLGPATAEALGYVRSFRPADLHAVYVSDEAGADDLQDRWREFCRGNVELERLPTGGGSLLERVKEYVRGVGRGEDEFVTVVVPEQIVGGLIAYLVRGRASVRLKAGLLREPGVVVSDVPVVVTEEGNLPLGVDGLPLVPPRTVALVFVSGVHAASARAIRYAKSLRATETRAVYFALDPNQTTSVQEEWAARGIDVPLDIIEAPFRDLSGPLIDEVRRYTAREDTVVSVVIAELVTRKWWHVPLHRHHDLFVKRALLWEPRVILSSVPYFLE